jgi:hypothetical protein
MGEKITIELTPDEWVEVAAAITGRVIELRHLRGLITAGSPLAYFDETIRVAESAREAVMKG